ncbi:MAG: molybdopterin-guanine dinucleotide biosynthesis protein B, partial [Polynucleobacter victoriensis]
MTNNSQSQRKTPVIGFVAYSGTGKTTLIEQLITCFTQQGINIAVIKHTHH